MRTHLTKAHWKTAGAAALVLAGTAVVPAAAVSSGHATAAPHRSHTVHQQVLTCRSGAKHHTGQSVTLHCVVDKKHPAKHRKHKKHHATAGHGRPGHGRPGHTRPVHAAPTSSRPEQNGSGPSGGAHAKPAHSHPAPAAVTKQPASSASTPATAASGSAG